MTHNIPVRMRDRAATVHLLYVCDSFPLVLSNLSDLIYIIVNIEKYKAIFTAFNYSLFCMGERKWETKPLSLVLTTTQTTPPLLWLTAAEATPLSMWPFQCDSLLCVHEGCASPSLWPMCFTSWCIASHPIQYQSIKIHMKYLLMRNDTIHPFCDALQFETIWFNIMRSNSMWSDAK